MEKKLIIAIDGYSSCGKSTFAKAIARELNYLYIDSGAMYRAVTLYCLRKGYAGRGEIRLNDILADIGEIDICFVYNSDIGEYETYLNNENVEREIRGIEVSSHVSRISQIPEVREKMVELQRQIGVFKGIVMDGRDIGTVVFPDADLKIFMTASVDIRAKRRYDELIAKGDKVSFEEVLTNITLRDNDDTTRSENPLIKADDAVVIDNSNLTQDEQYQLALKLAKDCIAQK